MSLTIALTLPTGRALGQNIATTADPALPVSVSLSAPVSSCAAGQPLILSGSATNAAMVFVGVSMAITATLDDGDPDDANYVGGGWQNIIEYPDNKVLTGVSVMLWLDPSVWSPGGWVTENCGDLAPGQSVKFSIPVTAVSTQISLLPVLTGCVNGALDTYAKNGSLVFMQVGD